MNERPDNTDKAQLDAAVAERYAALAGETTPPELDRRVMQAARQASTKGRSRLSLVSWMRPAAIAATVILSVAVILDLNENGLLEPPVAGAPSPLPPAPDESEPQRRTAAETANALRREKATAALPAKPAAPRELDDSAATSPGGDTSVTFADERESIAADASALRQGARNSEYRTPGPNALPADRVMTEPAGERACSDDLRSDPGRWWGCVESLRIAGQEDWANLELEALRLRYPAFVIPE